jgi:hypothetical protein
LRSSTTPERAKQRVEQITLRLATKTTAHPTHSGESTESEPACACATKRVSPHLFKCVRVEAWLLRGSTILIISLSLLVIFQCLAGDIGE